MALYNAVIDTVTGRIGTTGAPPAGAGGDPNILWQWDGTLGDFTNGNQPEVNSGGNGVLSLVTTYRGNPAIRLTTGGTGQSSFAIDPAKLAATLPRRYTLQYTIEEMGDGLGGFAPSSQIGVSPFCQYNGPGNILAYTIANYGNLASFRQLWTLNNNHGLSGGTPSWASTGAGTARGLTCNVDIELLLGPVFDMNIKGLLNIATGSSISRWYNDATLLDFNGTTFNDKVPNTIGLAGHFFNAGHYIEFSQLTLLKHPADR